jgi:hypothetical protein
MRNFEFENGSTGTRGETRKPWSGPVTWLPQKWQYLNSYSSRSDEIFFNEIYKSSKQINSAKRLLNRYYLCVAKFGTNQLKSLKTPSMFSKIYRYFWRFSTTGKAASKLHLGVSMQVVIHTKFAFSRPPRLFTPGETKALERVESISEV